MQMSPIPLIFANNAPEIMVAKALAPLPVCLSTAANAHETTAYKVGAARRAHPEGPTHPEGFVIQMIGITIEIEGKSLRTMSHLPWLRASEHAAKEWWTGAGVDRCGSLMDPLD
jgi:hypothetical protein